MEVGTLSHYSGKQKILVVGEGDFSFSLCLAKAFGSATNMVATSLESQDSVIMKYSIRTPDNLLELENLGCTILHSVNAHTMSRHPSLADMLFDRIVFNFPQNEATTKIRSQQKLVMGFMRNAREILREDGEIHVTHKTAIYDEWDMETLGSECGLYMKDDVPFHLSDYKGYSVMKGDGRKKKLKGRKCSTFILIKDSSVEALSLKVESLTQEVSELRALVIGSTN